MGKVAEICEVNVSDLVPYERNAKTHGPEQVEKIARSIEEFGFLSPCLIDRDNNIIAGHGRVLAAKELGLKKIPCVYVEGLTDDQRRAYILADNRLTELGGWDMDAVTIELEELDNLGFDITLTGFDFDCDTITETVEDDYDVTPPEEPRAKRGDVYKLGTHRLICGDATVLVDVAKLMDGEAADMLFTDPPYGVDYATKNEFLNAYDKGNRIQKDIAGDALATAEEEKDELWVPALSNAYMCADDKCSYYIASPQGGELMMMMMIAIREAGWQLKHTIIWNKNNHVLGRSDYNYKHEPILYGWKKTHTFYGGGKFKTSVWDIPKPQKSDLHPTMKPIELVAECILNSTVKGDNVLDVFGGSGTTLIACEQTGRRCFIMELDPHYVDVIIDRWEKFTGQKAELI